MPAPADRNLLFGLLALQTGMIDQSALVAAFHAWTRDKSLTLADLLFAQGAIDDAARGALETLVAQHVRRHGDDVEKSLADVPMPRPVLAGLAGVGDADVNTTLGHVGGSGTVSSPTERDGDRDRDRDATATMSMGTASGDGQRFRVLRPHARGGLGEVFVALDAELNREVALKQILDRHADDPDSRTRFVLEAEITGGLEHPGIVPVYGLGSYGSGRPYYAMRFVRGDSLKDAIAAFHRHDETKADPGRRSLALRKLLRRFTDVCNAIEYAHTRGVIHRDIKPSNVIVGRHGETLVVDWGLAKAIGRSDTGTGTEERTLTPSSASGSAETLPGSAVGTPAYMSPEQAAGDIDRLGPRSDVYSLGATLYCLLTGRPPFSGDDVGALLRAVREGDFPTPRALDATIDRALEAVCLKAMAVKPEGRYATPRALADDVDRWMADEPITARRDPWVARAARWGRRHRAAVVGAAAVLLSAVVALSAGTLLLGRANARVRQQERLAAENARMASAAVDDYLTRVSEDRLLKSPQQGMQALRKELLSTALGYYQEFVRRREGDPSAREDLAAAYSRLGEINSQAGTKPEAGRAFRASYDLWASLLAGRPDVSRYEIGCAKAEQRLGDTQLDLPGQAAEGEAHLRKAADRLEGVARIRPDDPDVLLGLTRIYGSLASRAVATRQDEEPALHEKAIETAERLARVAPGKYDADLAGALMNRGYRFARDGRAADALRDHGRARDILMRLTAASPHDTDSLIGLARAYVNIGFVHQSITRDAAEASRQFALSAGIDERLVEENPRVASHRRRLASRWAQDLETRLRAGQREGLEGQARRVVAMFESAAALDPENSGIRYDLAYGTGLLGRVLESTRPDQAYAAFEKSIALQQKAVKADPGNLKYRFDLRSSYDGLSRTLFVPGKTEAALGLLRGVIADNPVEGLRDDAKIRAVLYRSLSESVMGRALLLLGRQDESISLFRHVLAVRSEAAARDPNWVRQGLGPFEARIGLGLALRKADPGEAATLLAEAETELAAVTTEDRDSFLDRIAVRVAIGETRPASRARFHEMAVSDLGEAVASGIVEAAWLGQEPGLDPLRGRADFRDLLARVRASSEARFLARRAAWDEAEGRADQASDDYRQAAAELGGLERLSAIDHYNVGRYLARSSRLAKGAGREAMAGRATDALRRAAASGFRDLATYRNDTDLDTLRDRPDFRLLIMDLAFPADPFARDE